MDDEIVTICKDDKLSKISLKINADELGVIITNNSDESF